MLQIRGVKGEAVVSYCEPLTTQVIRSRTSGEMGYHRLVRLWWRAFPKGKQNEDPKEKSYSTDRRDTKF
jgi:hypothetical protein